MSAPAARESDPDVALTDDCLLDGRVRLRQPANGYRASVDAVLLAAAVPARPGDRVLELGIGVGAAALCLAARVPDCRITGLEIDPAAVTTAHQNIADNDAAARIHVVEGDVANPPAALGSGYDHVMANPPYLPADRADARAPAHPANIESSADLTEWMRLAVARTRAKGTVTVIHRADRLDDLLAALRPLAGGVTVFPLWPGAGAPAKRVIVRARPGVRAPLTLSAGLCLHEPDGAYTAAAEAVLRAGAGLSF